MIVILGAALIVLTLVLALIVRMLTEAQGQLEASWVQERRELLERIQRPEHPPITSGARFEAPEQEPDEWNLVGTISYDQTPEEAE